MSKLLRLSFAAIFILGATHLRGQSASRKHTELNVRSVHTVPQIYVTVAVRTASEQLLIPFCGELDPKDELLCALGAHLQAESSEGWRPAELRTTFGVLGAPLLKGARGHLVAPNSEAVFVFEFSRRFFKVEPGQRLRVVVDAWPDEQSMRSNPPSTQLISPPFECPRDAGV